MDKRLLLLGQKHIGKLYVFGTGIAIIICIVLNFPTNFENIIEISGTFIQIALPIFSIVPIVQYKDKLGLKQMLFLLSACLLITYTLKLGIHSKRPYGGSMSFPSGHTVGAFVGAFFLTRRYGFLPYLWSLPLAAFVGVSRILSRNHWTIDVVTSVLICSLCAILIVRKFNAADTTKKINQFTKNLTNV